MASILDQIMNYSESNTIDATGGDAIAEETKQSDPEAKPLDAKEESCGKGKCESAETLEESAMLTEAELTGLYTEAVAEVIRESKDKINEKYKAKKELVKTKKARDLAKKKAAEKKAAIKEAADPNSVIDQIFDAF